MSLSVEEAISLFSYCPDSGYLLWKSRPLSMFKREKDQKAWNNRFSGKRAGYDVANPKGYTYRRVRVHNREYLEHRIIWMIHTGSEPPKEIDHVNRNATDNRWLNLRDAEGNNQKNKSKQRNNTSGLTGISQVKKTGAWRAQCAVDGKPYTVGTYMMKHKAIEALEEFRRQRGFHEGHGETLPHYAD